MRGAYALFLFLTVACSTESGSIPEVAVLDSAGVTIVTSNAATLAALPQWTLETELTLGGPGQSVDREFYNVFDARLLSGGGVAVVNRGTAELRFFDKDGLLLGSVGRDGDGPQELRGPVGIREIRGDSLVVLDRTLQRLAVLDPSLRITRTIRLPSDIGTTTLVGIHGGESVIIQSTNVRPPFGAGIEDNPTTVLVYNLDGQLLDSLGTYPALRWTRLSQGAIARPEFDATTTFSAAGRVIWVGTGRSHEVARLDESGSMRLIARWAGGDLTIGEAERSEWRSSMLDRATTPEEVAAAQSRIESAVFPEAKAAFARIVADRDGDVWIQPVGGSSAPDSIDWLVVGDTGHLRAAVRTPATWRIFDVHGDAVSAVRTDDFGVEHVVRARIQR